MISWLASGVWWHWAVAYLVGYVAFVTITILVWGFVYRPKLTSSQFEDTDPWTGEEVVNYALAQGIIWPVFAFCYLVTALSVGMVVGAVQGGSKLAQIISKGIPYRPPGFQVRK